MKAKFGISLLALTTVVGGTLLMPARKASDTADEPAISHSQSAANTTQPARIPPTALLSTTVPVAPPSAVSPTAAPSAPARVERLALQDILPSLHAPVSDWRTFTPKDLTVVLAPGLPLDFTAKSITTDGTRTTWIGTNDVEGATLVACATETLWDAIVTVPGSDEYSIRITPDSASVTVTAHGLADCGQANTTPQLLATPPTGTLTAGPSAAALDPTSAHVADLLVLYSTGAKNNWGTAAEMENRINTVVTAANLYLEQSQITNLRWRLVGTSEAPAYPTTENLENDLDRLADPGTELGRFAAERRSFYGADQVMFIVDGTRDYAGIAYLGIGSSGAAFSVVHHPGTAATAAHELAHNFGCRHDRQTEEAADNNDRYYYGHRFNHNGQDRGTLMSYAPYLAPYFSNPAINYEGNPVGIAADQPKGADNARYLREHAANVANLRASKTTAAPMITTQPASITVTTGQPISLSVTATGNDLTYQWIHDGVNVAGATTATYSKSGSTSADAGSYTVRVSNLLGSAVSTAASVTVNPAPVVPPQTTSGSSGGGGGELGITFAFCLLALLGGATRRRTEG